MAVADPVGHGVGGGEGGLADQGRHRSTGIRLGEPADIPDRVTSMVGSISAPRVIVVVEDETLIRFAVVSALEEANFGVIEAGHAGEALAILQHEAVRVHVVFTDVHMPGPMDGLMLAHHVRRHWPRIGLLVASGQGIVSEEAMPEGSRFIPKPYRLDHVVHHIRELAPAPD